MNAKSQRLYRVYKTRTHNLVEKSGCREKAHSLFVYICYVKDIESTSEMYMVISLSLYKTIPRNPVHERVFTKHECRWLNIM